MLKFFIYLNKGEQELLNFQEYSIYSPPVCVEVDLLTRLLTGHEEFVIVGYKGKCYKCYNFNYNNIHKLYSTQVAIVEVGYPENKFKGVLECPAYVSFAKDSAKTLWRYIRSIDIEIHEFFK